MSKIMNAILEGVDGGTIEQTVEGYKRVSSPKPDAVMIELCNQLEIEIDKLQSAMDKQDAKGLREYNHEFSTQDLLEFQGEAQTYHDLEFETSGVEPYYYPGKG